MKSPALICSSDKRPDSRLHGVGLYLIMHHMKHPANTNTLCIKAASYTDMCKQTYQCKRMQTQRGKYIRKPVKDKECDFQRRQFYHNHKTQKPRQVSRVTSP